MTRFRAHYDGAVLVPDDPVDLPVGCELEVTVVTKASGAGKALQRLVKLAEQFPENPDLPIDGADQHDHYMYGTPRRP